MKIRNRLRCCGCCLLYAIVLYLYLHLFVNALIDDAFILLCYVKNLHGSVTWGFFPGCITNTATCPLNVLVLTAVDVFTRLPLDAAIWTAVISLTAQSMMLLRISGRLFGTEWFGHLAALALIFNPLLVSTIGMEGVLVVALIVATLYCYVFHKWYWAAVVLALQMLTRPEGALYFLVFVAFVPTNRLRVRCAAIFAACIAPWYLFSWIYFGSLFPDTLILKVAQHAWPEGHFLTGLLCYLRLYPTATVLSLAFLPLLALYFPARMRKHRVVSLLASFGVIHFAAYSLLHVPPYHWYYVPLVTTIILLGSCGLGFAYRGYRGRVWPRRLLLAVTAAYLAIPCLGMLDLLARDRFVVKEVPIHSNSASHERYREIGLWLKERRIKDNIFVEDEIGTIAYYSDCRVLNVFSDRSWLKPYLLSVPPGLKATLLKIDYLFLRDKRGRPPCSYFLTKHDTDVFDGKGTVCKKWKLSSRWKPHSVLVLSTK